MLRSHLRPDVPFPGVCPARWAVRVVLEDYSASWASKASAMEFRTSV